MKEKWGIDTNILMPNYQNKEPNYLLHLYQNYIFNDSGKFNEEDIELISAMVKIGKSHSKNDLKETQSFEESMKNFIQLSNRLPFRYPIILKCNLKLY